MTETQPDLRRKLLVYRDRIGAPSEIAFSRRQYIGFRHLKPVWTGRVVLPGASGLGQDVMRIGAVRGLLFRHLGMSPPLDATNFIPAVHAQFARGGALALPLARAMHAAMVVTLHGGDVGKDKNWRPHTLLARRWPEVIARTYRFICVSAAVAETAARRGAPVGRLIVLPIGVELPSHPSPGHPRDGLLFTGRFVEKKGIDVLAAAMRHLRALGDMTPLVCAGDGPLLPLLEALARDIPGVALTGWLTQDAIAAQMNAARVLLVPSVVARGGDAEGLPSVVMEAMAHGCTVIGTDQGGIAEAITDGETGLLVPPGDPMALASAMHRLTASPDLAQGLAASGFEFVGRRLNALVQSAALEAIVLEAAAAQSDTATSRPGGNAMSS